MRGERIMKKTKKIISLLLSVLMIITALPLTAVNSFAADEITSGVTGDCTWSLDGTVLTISGNGEMGDCDIGSSPYGNLITNVIIEDGVANIGRYAFADCASLTSITIPDSVTSIEDGAFHGCASLASITIPDSVTIIDTYTFVNCTSLTNITIPDSVTSIEYGAFAYCKSLTSIIIPDSVTSIGNIAFEYTAYYNDESNWDNGILYIGNHLIKAKRDISGSVAIKQGTKIIADFAFSYCKSLTSITIPDSVTSIGLSTFYDCTSLTSITIPDSATSIGKNAFADCTSLTSITIPDSVTNIGNKAFPDTAYYNDKSNWDNGILYIGNHLIEAKRNISGSVEIRQGTKTIADFAFCECESLTSITIPDSVTDIGNYAFGECTSLESVTIPDSVKHIAKKAFGYNTSINGEKKINGFTIYGISGTAAERYAKNNSFNFVDIREPESITVSKSPAKTTYFLGDTLDTTGLELIATYSNGDTETVTSGYTVSGFDSETAGTKTVTVTYKEKDTTFEVEVVEPNITLSNDSLSFDNIGSSKTLTVTTAPSDQNITWTSSNTSVATVSDDGVVTAKGDGNATITAKFTYNNIEYTATCNVTVKVPAVPTATFPDVASGEWYYNAIKFNVDKGYFHGYANGYFGPGNNIQRQDFVVVLSKIAGADLSAYAGQNGGFSDVPTNDYYSAAVAWAKDNHILSGYANGKFGVGDPITREQACLIFYNYCNGEVSGEVDAVLASYPDGENVSDWARTAVAWAAENHIVGGNGKLNPAGNANRAEMAQIIMNMTFNGML